MKWKLFICGMVLIAAGCASNQNQYSNFGERGFTFDYSPAPIPGRSPNALARDYLAPIGTPLIADDIVRESPPYFVGAAASPSPMVASSNP